MTSESNSSTLDPPNDLEKRIENDVRSKRKNIMWITDSFYSNDPNAPIKPDPYIKGMLGKNINEHDVRANRLRVGMAKFTLKISKVKSKVSKRFNYLGKIGILKKKSENLKKEAKKLRQNQKVNLVVDFISDSNTKTLYPIDPICNIKSIYGTSQLAIAEKKLGEKHYHCDLLLIDPFHVDAKDYKFDPNESSLDIPEKYKNSDSPLLASVELIKNYSKNLTVKIVTTRKKEGNEWLEDFGKNIGIKDIIYDCFKVKQDPYALVGRMLA